MDDSGSTNAEKAKLPSSSSSRLRKPGHRRIDDLQEFFVDDNGNLLILLPAPDGRGKLSPEAVGSTSTKSSLSTKAPQDGVVDLSLLDICDHIDDHPSLRAAQIISSECYAELVNAVMRRFILLELRRPGRKTVWVRVDRRREEGMSFMRFFAASKVTKPNDRAILSADKGSLVREAFRENTQVFEVPQTLAEFTRLLRIITEEIVPFSIWPENGWFFCSLIQQHLGGSQTGWFTIGAPKSANLANDIRTRISSRILAGRQASSPPRASAAPSPEASTSAQPLSPPPYSFSTPLPPTSLSPSTTPSLSPNTDAAVYYGSPSAYIVDTLWKMRRDRTVVANIRMQIVEALKLAPDIGPITESITPTHRRACERFVFLLDNISFNLGEAKAIKVSFRREAARLQRALFVKTPLNEQGELARLLVNLGCALNDNGRPDEACIADEEALLIRQDIYGRQPSASRSQLARLLYNYGIHLSWCKRYTEACTMYSRAINLYVMLYEQDAGKYRVDLAETLHNSGICLYRMQHFAQARLAYEGAIAFCRQLYKRDPERHRKNLALCLKNYSITLDDLGMVQECRSALEESKTLWTEMKSLSAPLSGEKT